MLSPFQSFSNVKIAPPKQNLVAAKYKTMILSDCHIMHAMHMHRQRIKVEIPIPI